MQSKYNQPPVPRWPREHTPIIKSIPASKELHWIKLFTGVLISELRKD